MISGVMIISFIVIIVVIALTVIVTLKAYSVTYTEKIDPLPPKNTQNGQTDLNHIEG